MQDEPDAADLRRDLAQCFHPFSGDCSLQNGETGEVAAGLRHARDIAAADRIADQDEYDWNDAGFLLHDRRDQVRTRHDYVRCHADQLFGEAPRLIGIAAGPADIELDIAARRPTQIPESLLKCRYDGRSFSITFAIWQQHPDPPHGLALLRACGERPSSRGTAEQRDEFPSSHESSHAPDGTLPHRVGPVLCITANLAARLPVGRFL